MIPIIKRRHPLITYNEGNVNLQDEYEAIKFNIEFLAYENNCKSLLITSPSEKEGKSTIVANLAISMAQSGKRVLLIDSNIRKPSIHHLFKIKNSIGLTNVLAGQRQFSEVINQTELTNLHILTSGPIPFDSEKLFRSHAMEELLTIDAAHYDYVFVDSPAVLENVETKLFASKCDGAFLVIRSGKTEDALALEAKDALQVAKAKMLGVIFNGKRKKFFNRRRR